VKFKGVRNLPEGEGRWEKEIRREGLKREKEEGVERAGRIEEEAMGTSLTNTIELWMRKEQSERGE